MVATKRPKRLNAEEKVVLAAAKEAILRHQPATEIVLYGSAARGDRSSDSDYDLLLITSDRLSTAQEDLILDSVYDVELVHNAIVSVVFCARSEWESAFFRATPYYKNVKRDGVAL